MRHVAGCGLDQPVVDRRAPSPITSDKKAICEPIPPNLLDDVTKRTSPMQIPSPDRADAQALVFADDELCVDRQPMKNYFKGPTTTGPTAPKPPQSLSPTEAIAARRLKVLVVVSGSSSRLVYTSEHNIVDSV